MLGASLAGPPVKLISSIHELGSWHLSSTRAIAFWILFPSQFGISRSIDRVVGRSRYV